MPTRDQCQPVQINANQRWPTNAKQCQPKVANQTSLEAGVRLEVGYRPTITGVQVGCAHGTGWHWLALVGIGWHWLALVGTGWHWLALVGTGWHWLALVGIGWHWLALVGTGWHWLALVGTGWHWLALVGCCGDTTIIVVCDVLHRHSLAINNFGKTEEALYELSLQSSSTRQKVEYIEELQ